jgi:hypothetical protein
MLQEEGATTNQDEEEDEDGVMDKDGRLPLFRYLRLRKLPQRRAQGGHAEVASVLA